MNEKSNLQNELSRVLKKICEIAEKSADGDYIFRGEPELHKEPPYYGRVSSNLCREYLDDIEEEGFQIEFVQKEILDEAKKYSDKGELEILTELQHYGSKTNLIDFTTDYLIALFFACDGLPNKNGRVILQKRSSVESFLQRPREPRNRVMAQKSIFVRPPKGYINPDKVITIKADLKETMLEYLRNSHSISTETIYNDLHGFIKNRGIHESAYTEFHRGNTCQNRADSLESSEKKQEWYNRAIIHYTEALKLKPDLWIGYNNRGNTYLRKGEFDRAIQDYDRAIELNPEDAGLYNNRGNTYGKKGDFDRAIQDHDRAIELDPNDAMFYSNRGNTYEEKGEFDRAIQDYDRAIELNPNNAMFYSSRGNTYSKKGDFDRAIQDYDRAIELDPDDAKIYNNRGNAYLGKGEFDRAIQDYDRTIELDPNDAKVYSNLGAAYLRKGDFDRAIENHNMAIKLDPGFAELYSNRGEVWLPLKQWKKARADLTFARNAGVDIVASFHNDYESVADFEQKNSLQLPEDIKAMLTR